MSNSLFRTNRKGAILALTVALCIIGSSCKPQTKPPVRSFSTSDLLISPLSGWKVLDEPTVEPGSFFNLRDAVTGSTVRFVKPLTGTSQGSDEAQAKQWVVRFPFIEDAAQAYHDHYFSSNTGGTYPTKFEPLNGFNYTSMIANQFRVVCDVGWSGPSGGKLTLCFAEGQYDEFYTLVNYDTFNSDDAAGDLEAISQAIDQKMSEFLGSVK